MKIERGRYRGDEEMEELQLQVKRALLYIF